MRHKNQRKLSFYTCGRCKGKIPFLAYKGRPKVCPECGYGHGTRPVNNVPTVINADFNSLQNEASGSRGKLEKTIITSR